MYRMVLMIKMITIISKEHKAVRKEHPGDDRISIFEFSCKQKIKSMIHLIIVGPWFPYREHSE